MERRQSIVSVAQMDCPSEENLIRMKLGGRPDVESLAFDLARRELTIVHTGEPSLLLALLEPLRLGAALQSSSPLAGPAQTSADDAGEASTLRALLAINAVMFVIELVAGILAQSSGLVADSLDMFADAAVYGLALLAVGQAASRKVRAARVAGLCQLLLAVGVLAEVARKAVLGSEPMSSLMFGAGVLALVANVACLLLIARKRDRGVHMSASYIFSANDVIANLGVLAAALLVAWTGSRWPDLVIGALIGILVLNGARRIFRLA